MTKKQIDQFCFETFAKIYPYESCKRYPVRFWKYFHRVCPKISKAKMKELLDATRERE